MVKQFKLSCSKIGTQIGSMLVKNTKFTGFIQEFTENTYILIVVSDPKIQPAAMELNVECARKFFEKNRNSEMDNLLVNWKA